jgi:hypothetical protein
MVKCWMLLLSLGAGPIAPQSPATVVVMSPVGRKNEKAVHD